MIIDCHGHYTTAPAALQKFRDAQIAGLKDRHRRPAERAGQDQRRSDSRQPGECAAETAARARHGPDDLLAARIRHGASHRQRDHQPALDAGLQRSDPSGVPVCTRRTSSGCASCRSRPACRRRNSAAELERCVKELGFVGCNLNPDPSGGHWTAPPLTDRHWYPLYEKMVELDVPAMVHVSASCNPNFHATGAHYINADTTAFMQFLTGDLFKDFPTLRFIIPHGGGAVPYHWGRYRGLAQDMKRPLLGGLRAEECVLRHLRVSPAGHRAAAQGHPGGQHPVRLGDGGRGARHRS